MLRSVAAQTGRLVSANAGALRRVSKHEVGAALILRDGGMPACAFLKDEGGINRRGLQLEQNAL